MTKRGGLGRGLAALIPTSAPPAEQAAPPRATEPEATPTPAGAPPVSLVPPPAEAAPAAPDSSPAGPGTEETVGIPGAQLREVAVDDVDNR